MKLPDFLQEAREISWLFGVAFLGQDTVWKSGGVNETV